MIGDDTESHVNVLPLSGSQASGLTRPSGILPLAKCGRLEAYRPSHAGSVTSDWQRTPVFLAAQFFEVIENRTKDVSFVIGDRAGEIGEVFRSLGDCGHALETHSGIDVP